LQNAAFKAAFFRLFGLYLKEELFGLAFFLSFSHKMVVFRQRI